MRLYFYNPIYFDISTFDELSEIHIREYWERNGSNIIHIYLIICNIHVNALNNMLQNNIKK